MINEIVFQGIFGCYSPVRIDARDRFIESELPSSVDFEDANKLLLALFFPSRLDEESRRQVEMGQDVKIAATFEAMDRTWRILRRDSDDSLRLQMREQGAYRDVGEGPRVEELLQDKLRFPPYAVFQLLNLWKFDEPLPPEQGGPFRLDALDSRARDIVLRYKRAVEIEEADDVIQKLTQRAEQARQRLGEGAKLEEKLEKARERHEEIAVAELSDEELELLQGRDERLKEFEAQILRLEREEEDARYEVDEALPDKPWKNQLFWAGLALGIGALAISIAMRDTMRPIAAANVIGFGMTAWALLRYFTDMERASVHLVRLDSIKRRLNQVREEQVSFTERVGHLMIHAGVEDEAEFNERFEKSNRLAEIIEKMERQLSKLQAKPAYQEARRELDEILEELEAARARREEMGTNMMSSYQLENDLQELGIDPNEALEALESGEEEPEPEPYDRDEFTRLHEIARRCGLAGDGGLDPRVARMWSKICAHVIGARFKRVELSNEGELRVADLKPEQIEMWANTRPSEVRIVAQGLATALLVNLPSKVGSMPCIFVPDPGAELSSEQAARLREVLRSATKKSQVILLK